MTKKLFKGEDVCRFCGKKLDIEDCDTFYIEEFDTDEDKYSCYVCDDCVDNELSITECTFCGDWVVGEGNIHGIKNHITYVEDEDLYLCPVCYQEYLKENEED